MEFAAMPETMDAYVDLDGQEYDLTQLDAEVRTALSELLRYYNWKPPYPQFRTYWRDTMRSPVKLCLKPDHPANRSVRAIARDLERRLGICQGRLEE